MRVGLVEPKISIIIPVYNVERYLRECLDSVVNQTLKDIEIICVNDGSTDGSPSILKDYASQDDRIVVINKCNAGYGAAMNDGLDMAKGEYIGIVESDDYILPEMYETLYETAKSREQIDIVKSNFKRFWGTGRSGKFEFVALSKKKAHYNTLLNPASDIGLLRANGLNQPGIYRKAFLSEHDIRFNESPGAAYQDNGFWFQIFAFANTAYFIDAALYFIRRDNPNSSVKNQGQAYAICLEYDHIRNTLKKKGAPHPNILEMCAVMRYVNYQWTIARIAPELRKEFIERFRDDFAQLAKTNELSRMFFTPSQWNELSWILRDPNEYYYALWFKREELDACRAKIRRLESDLAKADRKISDLRSCNSYKIGRAATFIPRAFKRAIKYTESYRISHTTTGQSASVPPSNIGSSQSYSTMIDSSTLPSLLKEWYEKNSGDTLDFDHPVTYNQKIQWLKLHDSTPIKTQLADKLLVRDWVARNIGDEHLIPLLGVWDSFDQIDFSSLPSSFVLKMNDSSGHNIVVENKGMLDIDSARLKFERWLTSSFTLQAGYEMHYKDIEPKIIAEKYLYEGKAGLTDYRLFCFDGEPFSIWVDIGSGTRNHKRDIYDLNWNLQPILVNYPNLSTQRERPAQLDTMISLARKLSKGFCHVRVDLYYVDGKIYFGEMTFTPQSGIGKWDPPEFNYLYGRMLNLPNHDPGDPA